jgi:hypothetical protein
VISTTEVQNALQLLVGMSPGSTDCIPFPIIKPTLLHVLFPMSYFAPKTELSVDRYDGLIRLESHSGSVNKANCTASELLDDFAVWVNLGLKVCQCFHS